MKIINYFIILQINHYSNASIKNIDDIFSNIVALNSDLLSVEMKIEQEMEKEVQELKRAHDDISDLQQKIETLNNCDCQDAESQAEMYKKKFAAAAEKLQETHGKLSAAELKLKKKKWCLRG